MKILYLLAWLCGACGLYAQTGSYLLMHYQPDGQVAGQTFFDMVQDENGLMYFATQRGVARFDGQTWDLLRTDGIVYDLLLHGQHLYTAGGRGAGKITLHTSAAWHYEPLPGTAAGAPFFGVAVADTTLLLLNDKNIFKYSADSLHLIAQTSAEWLALLQVGNMHYVSSSETQTLSIENNRLVPVTFAPLRQAAVLFAETWGNLTLMGTDQGRLFILESGKYLKAVKLADSAYAQASVVVSARWITPDLAALGTLRGGVIFINPLTGKTEQVINYTTGLPDNEVLALALDKDRSLWVAHRYGVTRIMPFLPFRSFAHYPGLQGAPLCAEQYNGTRYVGTSLGLFRLDRQDHYEEMTYYVQVPVQVKVEKEQTPGKSEPLKDKSRLFGFLRRRTSAPAETPVPEGGEQFTITYKREKRSVRVLRSSNYVFSKVPEIDARISKLHVWNNRLIACGLAGVWEINPSKTELLLDIPVYDVVTDDERNRMVAITHEGKVFYISGAATTAPRVVADTLATEITHALQVPAGALWLCGADKLVQRQTNGTHREIPVDNPDYDAVYGVRHGQHLYFASSGKVWRLDEPTFTLLLTDSLSGYIRALPDEHRLWLLTREGWKLLGDHLDESLLSYLSFIPNITGIHTEKSTRNLWLTTASGELIYLRHDVVLPVLVRYPLLLKQLTLNDVPQALTAKKISFTDENNILRVQVVLPEYYTPAAVQYRYRMTGLFNDWSAWSANHAVLDFPFLPEGKYNLEIQAKAPDGYVTPAHTLQIIVLPPYWKRWWFYALELGVFSLLVISSFRLSSRYRLVSRILSLLSIIILIEFIQTVAGTTLQVGGGPVAEFILQVIIAFIILPVEGYLRKVMLRSIEKNRPH